MTRVVSMKGVTLDLTPILAANESVVAIGNGNMNARGDLIGRGGRVVKKREDAVQEYYQNNPKAVKQVSLRNIRPDAFEQTIVTPAQALENARHEIQQMEVAKEQRRRRHITDRED